MTFIHESESILATRNEKSEFRSTKSETKSNNQNSNVQNKTMAIGLFVSVFGYLNLFRASSFVLQIY